jgi:hypothetical protein
MISITAESPKAGIRAARTSENEVRFGISICAARPAVAPARKARDGSQEHVHQSRRLQAATQARYFRNISLRQRQ